MSVSYTKSINNDFPNDVVNLASLEQEIRNSSITVAIDHLDVDDDIVTLWFKAALSAGEQTNLDTIISNHTGAKTVSIAKVKIAEEDIETGGNFATRTIFISANASSTVTDTIWWPYPISCLSFGFNTDSTQENDVLSLQIGKNTKIGVLTANTSSTSVWTSQNYIAGDIVTVTNATYGTRIYTCIQDTVNNAATTNINYWRRGFPLNVSPTVVLHAVCGRDVRLNNLSTQEEVGEIISIDNTNSKVYVSVAPTNSFLAATPTYFEITASVLKNFRVGKAGSHLIAESKIGGAYIPAETIVTITYTNNGGSDNNITGRVEYLY